MRNEPGRFDLEGFLPYQLAVLAARVSRDFARLYSQEFGITIPEWRVIAHIAQAGTVSVREIHARVDMDKSRISRAAGRLEAAGLVVKATSKGDRRLVALSLTKAGWALYTRIVPMAQRYETEVLSRLDPETAQRFRGTIRQLLEEEAV
ncbi:MAG: MarR family winged helix-turn-helix transcriptional regulator [Pseudomonadota bacterium]